MAGLSRLRVATLQLRQVTRTRAYGSAAAAQLQYDDEDCDFHGEASEPMLRLDSAGSPPIRGVQWVLIGDPGVNKHVYAEKLSKLLEVPHISMGSLVRQELSPQSALYKQIANAVNEGKLVPEDVIFALLSKRLEEGYYQGESGFILDGLPRTRIQAGKSLEDYYRKQMKLLDFQVAGAPGETWQGLLAALHLQHLNAVSSSQKLTA